MNGKMDRAEFIDGKAGAPTSQNLETKKKVCCTGTIFSGNSFQATFNINSTGTYLPTINTIREFIKTVLKGYVCYKTIFYNKVALNV